MFSLATSFYFLITTPFSRVSSSTLLCAHLSWVSNSSFFSSSSFWRTSAALMLLLMTLSCLLLRLAFDSSN
jgi:hypothetical protein